MSGSGEEYVVEGIIAARLVGKSRKKEWVSSVLYAHKRHPANRLVSNIMSR